VTLEVDSWLADLATGDAVIRPLLQQVSLLVAATLACILLILQVL